MSSGIEAAISDAIRRKGYFHGTTKAAYVAALRMRDAGAFTGMRASLSESEPDSPGDEPLYDVLIDSRQLSLGL